MHLITPDHVTPSLMALFSPELPAALRPFAVLNGDAAGVIYADDPVQPTWGAVMDAGTRTLYPAGTHSATTLAALMAELRKTGDVLLGFWPDDPLISSFPAGTEYDGWVLDFTEHQSRPAPPIPDDCTLKRMDAALFRQMHDWDYYANIFGGVEQALEKGIGMCLIQAGQVVAEAFAGPAALGLIEIGTYVHEEQRRKGYGAAVCAPLIADCKQRGYRPYWNCARQNGASTALAERLGFVAPKDYRLWIWSGTAAG